jgi:hypothetical protein
VERRIDVYGLLLCFVAAVRMLALVWLVSMLGFSGHGRVADAERVVP